MKRKSKALIIALSIVLILAIVGTGVFLFGFYLPEREKRAELERAVKEYYQNKILLLPIMMDL